VLKLKYEARIYGKKLVLNYNQTSHE